MAAGKRRAWGTCAAALALALCGCARSPAPGEGDAGALGSPAVDAGEGAPFVTRSKHDTVLGRPTDRSVAVSVLASAGDACAVEYSTVLGEDGVSPGAPAARTAEVVSAGGEPIVLELTGLEPDTRYFYRVLFRARGAVEAQPDAVHPFRTQRRRGATFHFGVQGDTHPERFNHKMFHPDLYRLTLDEVARRQPDFYVLLGDDFSAEKVIENFKLANWPAGHAFTRAVEGSAPWSTYAALPRPFSWDLLVDGVGAPEGSMGYRALREGYLGYVGAASPLFLVNGNHEQAHLANLGGVFHEAAVGAATARLRYYPLPAPGGFYSGDTQRFEQLGVASNGYRGLPAPDGLLRDYFAFTWGDALFVTLDPYWHSAAVSPDSTLFSDPEPKWGATLGDAQYAWLKRTLLESTARWKFVFAHHVNGGNRGAARVVWSREWGGERGFAQNRDPATWDRSVHQLFVDAHVTIFFQGHDHLFARETVDGVVYQEVPSPADDSYFAYNCDAYAPASITWQGAAGLGVYDPSQSVRLPNTGFLDVTVGPEGVRVEYVRTYRAVDLAQDPNHVFLPGARSGEVAFRYSLPAAPTDTPPGAVPFTCVGAEPPSTWVYVP